MRPSILYPLFSPIESLAGVGKNYMRLLSGLCGEKAVDLLWHFPTSLIDRRCGVKLCNAQTASFGPAKCAWSNIARRKAKNNRIALRLKMKPNSLF